ncbi:MAG TPA: succinylglutamate desuccinylase/aspartoacylase family protein [Gammaproteobacteria bacterium]|nr:succinylglutamate desuccinylase/aspartoacylase family protein [Gammaproteobacteria bacterium]
MNGVPVKAGERRLINLSIPDLYMHTSLTIPVQVIHGKKDGPKLFVCAAIHGDEINGVEIIRRLMKVRAVGRLKGTLIAVPVVNVYGFIDKSRYLPDRRDLNRSFPGSESGSLAARLSHVFLQEIASRSTHGIDLHTAAVHRDNLPQIRAQLDDDVTLQMARAFSAPIILNTPILEGSLRHALEKMDISVIVYEAGEALRFNEVSIRAGVKGIVSVMREIGMLPRLKSPKQSIAPIIARSSTWVRAPQSGILRSLIPLGKIVEKNQVMGVVADPFGQKEEEVIATTSGMVVGRTNIPLVNEGEALFHIARLRESDDAGDRMEMFQQEMDPDTDRKPPSEPPIV